MKIAREVVRHPEASLRCLRLALDAFRGGLHRHGHAELTWIERGSGLRWVGDSVEPFSDGDLVLLGAELPHLWASRGPAARGSCVATVVQFPLDWAARTSLPELASVQPLLARAACGLAVQAHTRAAAGPLLARMAACSGVRRVAVWVELLAVLSEPGAALRPLATACAARAAQDDAAVAAGRSQRVDRLLSWIQVHLADPLLVDAAAARVGVSPAAFARFFRREVGKGFVDYVNDARCSWAALQLLSSDAPVARIAHDCGFATLSNFGVQFRRRHGVSPRSYRAQARQHVR